MVWSRRGMLRRRNADSTRHIEGASEPMAREQQKQPTNTRGTPSRIPHFKTVKEAAEFWDTHDSTEFEDEFEDVTDVRFVVTRAQPKKAITVRLGQDTVDALTKQAHEQGVGLSTLARMWILEHLQTEAKQPSRGKRS